MSNPKESTKPVSPSLPVESKESRHTPGPWAFELEWMPTGREESIVGRDGFPIANVRGTDDMSCIDEEEEEKFAAECKANAELIRSAPEMFSRLQAQGEELAKLRDKIKDMEVLHEEELANHNSYAAAEIEQKLGEELKALREHLRNVLKLIDDGWLVRNIKDDGEPDFYIRQLKPVMILKEAFAAAALGTDTSTINQK